jgi:hypothetical protein
MDSGDRATQGAVAEENQNKENTLFTPLIPAFSRREKETKLLNLTALPHRESVRWMRFAYPPYAH